MKKLAFALSLLLVIFVGCSKDDDTQPTLTFEKASYPLTKGSVEVKLNVSDIDLNSLTTPVSIPVQIGGTAVKGEDYTLSAEKFVLGGSEESKSIIVTAKDNYDEAKTITLTLANVPGYSLGNTPMTTINLGKKDLIMYSFTKRTALMSGGVTVSFDLYNSADGSAYVAEEEISIPIVVDETESTAVLGEQFSFDGDAKVVIPVGKSSGNVKLKYIAPVVQDKDIVVLKADLDGKKGFVKGQYVDCKISILGDYADKIIGDWVMNELVTDKENMDATWGGSVTFTKENGFPEFNAEDKLSIGDNGLTTEFKSTFKNYFGEQSGITIGEELELRKSLFEKITLQLLELTNINRFFSASETSEDDKAIIGVRITEEGLLDVYILDYYSKSFAPEFIDFGMYGEDKPVATMSGVFLNFTMKKAE